MSRIERKINQTTTVVTGNDHAIGQFLQVQDVRYARSNKDDQGEGYILEYDTMFGFTTNLVGATKEDIPFNDNRIIELTEAFVKTL